MSALSPTKVLEFKKEEILPFLLGHPLVMLEMIKVLAARVSELNRRLRGDWREGGTAGLQAHAYALPQIGPFFRHNAPGAAEMAGATIETTIPILSSMKQEKIIASSRGKITILDEGPDASAKDSDTRDHAPFFRTSSSSQNSPNGRRKIFLL